MAPKGQKLFKVGDQVFAKVRGYPAWPAFVVEVISKTKYKVEFYGTKEVGICKPQDLFSYLRHKARLSKQLKRVKYMDAIHDIEMAIAERGGDGITTISAFNESNAAELNINKPPTPLPEPITKSDAGPSSEKNEESKENVDGNNVKLANKGQDANGIVTDNTKQDNTVDSNTAELPNESVIINITPVNVEWIISYAEHVEKHRGIYESKVPDEKPDSSNNQCVFAKTPAGKHVAIKYNESKKNFATEYERAQHDKEIAINAKALKTSIEDGTYDPETNLEQFESPLYRSDVEVRHAIENMLCTRKKDRIISMHIETQLVDLESKLRTSLRIHCHDPKLLLTYLDGILELEIKPIMILKHPVILDTIMNLATYTGDDLKMGIEEDKLDDFNDTIEKIHAKAKKLTALFTDMFNTDEVNLITIFNSQLKDFNHKCTVLLDKDNNNMYLTEAPDSLCTFMDKMKDEESEKIIISMFS